MTILTFIEKVDITYVLTVKDLLIELRGMTLIFYLSAFAHNTHQMIIFCLHRVLYIMVFRGLQIRLHTLKIPCP